MPGYGYAAVCKEMSAGWVKLVRDYLRGRTTLLRAFVLVDGRHGVKASDEETFAALDADGRVLRRRADQARRGQAGARRRSGWRRRRQRCASTPPPIPEVFFTSARTGEGVPELRAHVARLLSGRGGEALR